MRDLYRLISSDGSFELFPNGHRQFMTRAALEKINVGREEALLRNDTEFAPSKLAKEREIFLPRTSSRFDGSSSVGGIPIQRGRMVTPKDSYESKRFLGIDDFRDSIASRRTDVEAKERAAHGEEWDRQSTTLPEAEVHHSCPTM